MGDENKKYWDKVYFDGLIESVRTGEKEIGESIPKEMFEPITKKVALFYKDPVLERINNMFWSKFDVVDLYNDEILKRRIKNEQFIYAAEFYQTLFQKIEGIKKRTDGSFIKIIEWDALKGKIAQRQIFYHLLQRFRDWENFESALNDAVPKESLSLEDLISGVDPRDFLWPEKTFFNIMYHGRIVPHLESPLTLLDLKPEKQEESSEERYFVEEILPAFKLYLIESKRYNPEKAQDFVDTSKYIFLDHIPEHKKVKKKILSIHRTTNEKIKIANSRYNGVLKEIENRKIITPDKIKELNQFKGYISKLQEISYTNNLLAKKIEQSYKAYLIMLNLNHDKFGDDGIYAEELKKLFETNHSVFRENDLFDLGYEVIKANMLEDENYDNPVTMASELIIKKLDIIEDKINNFTFEKYKKG